MLLPSLLISIALPQGIIPTFWQLSKIMGPIGTITYESDTPLDPDEFNYLFAEGLRSGLTYLSRKQKFSSVTLVCNKRKDATDVHLHLKSRWTFKKLAVHGVAFGRDSIAQHYGLEPGDPFDVHKHEHGIAAITQSLKDQGYFGVTVQVDLLHHALTKEVEVGVRIHKGRRYSITSVHMNQIADPALGRALDEINFDLIKRRYQADTIEKYEQLLRTQLGYHGYLHPLVQITHELHAKKRAVHVTTYIEPREQRIFEFEGAQRVSSKELASELVHLGISASLLPPALLAEELVCVYQKRGYPQAKISVAEQGNRTKFSISEGSFVEQKIPQKREIEPHLIEQTAIAPPQDKIIVAGVCPLPFRYILRESTRLAELDLCETFHMYPIMRIALAPPLEVRARAGVLGVSRNFVWQEGATYKVGGSIVWRNVAGRAGQFRIDGDVTKFEQRISLQYRHPWFFGLPYRTVLKGYYNRYNQPVLLGRNLPLYIAHQKGAVFSVSRTMRFLSCGINTGFEWLETSVRNEAAARAINFLPALNNVTVPYFYCEPTFMLDFLDDKVNPTRGAFTLVTLKGMVPFAKNHTTPFLKIQIEQSFFVPLGYSCVLGMRARAGHVFNALFAQIMPPDRFLLGGAWSVRGYEPDHVPPLGRLCDPQSGKIILVPQGGRTMGNVNLELRFPLWRKISGTLFQDFGMLLSDSFAAVKERLVAGSGFGVRYNTPVGPLRFDLGFRWGTLRPQESRAVWYLTLGNAF